MRTAKFALGLLCAATLLGAPQVEAKPGGCLKYGIAGAVAGHYAGHHAMKGAIAGCIAGMARRKAYNNEMEKQREEAAKKNAAITGAPSEPAPAATDGTAPSADVWALSPALELCLCVLHRFRGDTAGALGLVLLRRVT